MQNEEMRYRFGENWSRFIQSQLSPERLEVARTRLLGTLRREHLRDMSFLDIGCGSGLHSLAALQSGASSVLSFDYDPDSVATSRYLKEMHGNPPQWTILQGSVLDDAFMKSLAPADVVYSWGVLHHTGDMWKAIENARIPLKPEGIFFVALYSYTSYQNGSFSGGASPEQWLSIKKKYNQASRWGKSLMEYRYMWKTYVHHPNPIRCLRNLIGFPRLAKAYIASRGMEIWTDMRDWLGGWPMEFVKEYDFLRFATERLKLDLLDMHTGEGNTEFILRPASARNYWDAILKNRRTEPLPGPFQRQAGSCWSFPLPHLQSIADSVSDQRKSSLRLFENGQMLDYAHSLHDWISRGGHGRYSHWNDALLFSTSDNSDPNTNGRAYSIRYEI